MKKYKNYEAIYYLIKGVDDNQLKKFYEAYTGTKAKSPEGMYVNWALETVVAMAVSDGLTEEEMDVVFDW